MRKVHSVYSLIDSVVSLQNSKSKDSNCSKETKSSPWVAKIFANYLSQLGLYLAVTMFFNIFSNTSVNAKIMHPTWVNLLMLEIERIRIDTQCEHVPLFASDYNIYELWSNGIGPLHYPTQY